VGATGFVRDSNGNTWTGTINGPGHMPTDTLGRQPLNITFSPQAPTNGYWFTPPPVAFSLLNSQNGYSTYTPNWNLIHVHTNFQTPNFTDEDAYEYVLQSLTLPDSSTYTFTYDCDSSTGIAACGSPANQPGYYGVLTTITLPTGGQVTISYGNITDANGNVNRWVTSWSAGGGTWNYAQAIGCTPSPCQTVTITKPSGDQEVHSYDLTSGTGAWNTSTSYYSGAASGSPLMTAQTVYASYQINATFGKFGFVHPTTTTVTLPFPSGSLVKQTSYTFDSFSYSYSDNNGSGPYTGSAGKLLSQTETRFGSGGTGSPFRTTAYSYWDDANPQYKSIDLEYLPSDIQVRDASQTVQAETKMTYDSTALTSVTGVSNHDDTDFGTGYTTRGNPTQIQRLITGGQPLTASVAYDTTGQITQVTDAVGNQTSFGYDDAFSQDASPPQNPPERYSPSSPTNAYMTKITLPIIGSETFGYFYGTGKPAFSKDQNGADTYQHYLDALDRPTHFYLPLTLFNSNIVRSWQLYTYTSQTVGDSYGAIMDTTPSASCTSCRHDQIQLDGLGRTAATVLVSDPDGATTVSIGYDSTGRVKGVSNPTRGRNGGPVTYTYDGLDRILSAKGPNGSTVHVYYGASVSGAGGASAQVCSTQVYGLGYPTLYVDPAGKMRQIWTDAFGRTVEVDEPGSNGNLTTNTCYSYDVLDNLTGVLHLDGAQRTYAYDALSRLTSASDPESGATSLFYTTASGSLCSGDPQNVCRRTDARGITTTFSYDALNRLTGKSYSDSTPAVLYFYDQSSYNGLNITNGLGRRTGMSDGSGATAWSFDANQSVNTEMRTILGKTGSTSYAYNLDGSLASVIYPTGRKLNYTFSNAQRPLSVLDGTTGTSYASAATYAPQGALSSLVLGNVAGGFAGITETRTYDNLYQPQVISANSSAGLAFSLYYGYPLGGIYSSLNNGLIQSVTDNRTSGRSQSFVYDSSNRISSVQTTATSGSYCWGLSFGLDLMANLLSESVTKCSAPMLSLSVNAANHVTNSGFTYDPAGNMTSDGTHTYAYNAENQLTSVGSTNYSYDGDGKRVAKWTGQQGQVVQKYYWYNLDGSSVDDQSAGPNSPTDEYVFFAGRRIAHLDPAGNVYYLFSDLVGSTRVVTNSAGVICYDADFYPYGGEIVFTDTCDQPYKFGGYEVDPESGNHFAKYRFYNHSIGRFMSPDPVGGSPGNPQSWNAYSFVLNNPANLSDPFGLDSCIRSTWFSFFCTVGNADLFGESSGWTGVFGDFGNLGGGGLGPAGAGGDPLLNLIWTPHGFNPCAFGCGTPGPRVPPAFSPPSGPIPAPSFGNSLWPVVGPAWQSLHEFDTGHPVWGTVYAGLAISDVFLVKAMAVSVGRVGIRGIAKVGGSSSWPAVKSWMVRRGWRDFPGQEFHHWLIPQGGWGRFVPGFIKNQPWNIMRVSESGEAGQVFHMAIEGRGEQAMNLPFRYWYGSPASAKFALFSTLGRALGWYEPEQ
jgi:RHS repeat-associated protein